MNLYSLTDIFIIFVYIELLVILGIFIKPTFYINLIAFIYCCISTFIILKSCSLLSKQTILKYFITVLFTVLYSLFCVYCYVNFHKLYHKHIKQKKMYISLIILLSIPCIYFINVKLQEYYFKCGENIIIVTLSKIALQK